MQTVIEHTFVSHRFTPPLCLCAHAAASLLLPRTFKMDSFKLLTVLLLAGSVAGSLNYRQPGRGANFSTVHTGQKFTFRKEGGAAAFIRQLQPSKLQRIKNRSRFTGTTARLAALLDRDPDLVSPASGGLMCLQEMKDSRSAPARIRQARSKNQQGTHAQFCM